MLSNLSNLTIPGGNTPSEGREAPTNPPRDTEERKPKEGEIRKVDKEAYGDDYEVKQEEEMNQEEAKSENANKAGK